MKKSDVQIGGRYRAKVSGCLAVVRVTEIKEVPPPSWSPSWSQRWRTVIHAVNEATGRKITIRSAQRLRPLPVTIGKLNSISDLPADQRALPEKDVDYDLRLIDGGPLGLTVKYVFGQGEALVARASDGRDYPVTGTGNYVLVPRARGG
jgi:hypothetical protein